MQRPKLAHLKRRPAVALVAAVAMLVGGVGVALWLNHTPYSDAAWKQVVPGGDCHCADGSEFHFWERRADPTKVVLFLNGGGVCWDAPSCAFTSTNSLGESEFYGWASEDEPDPGGLFDFDRRDNPFADYSFLYVNSCTGDAHLGNVSQEYSPELTVEHNGYINGTAALDHLAANYPDADQVVVIGKTAGSVSAPLYGALVADRLPDAQVTVFGAQSGAWPDNPDFNTTVLETAWGAYDTMPDWAVEDRTASEWSVPGFWSQAGLHNPDLVLSRFDYAYDPQAAVEVTDWKPGEPMSIDPVPGSDELAVIDANEAAIEATGVTLHSYTAPGEGHGLFEYEDFYEIEVDDVRLIDWLDALATGEQVDDVHCDQCD